MKGPLRIRALSKCSINIGTGCWDWLGSCVRGYGQIGDNGRMLKAHRVVYEIFRGGIPQGLTIDHLCKNRSCVNPAHMEPVTLSVNVLRGSGPCSLNARKTHCKRGHELTEENIYKWKQKNGTYNRSCRVCIRARKRLTKGFDKP